MALLPQGCPQPRPAAGGPLIRLRAEGLRSAQAGPFDLMLEAGSCVAVMGPSGAGKSLLLRMLADLDPHEGEAWLEGVARSDMPAPAWRRQVALCAADSGWWGETVAEHFSADTGSLLPELGLSPSLIEGSVARLSTGERHRMALARTLLAAPPVLLLDEPTGALDEASTTLVEASLRARLRAGVAIVLVTHAPAQAQRLASRTLRIEAGRLA